MDANFETPVLAFTLRPENEGGFSNNPADPGGATNLGVTLKSWSSYIGRTATVEEIKALTVPVVTPFYRSGYWNLVHCAEIPAGLDLLAFEEAVNQGPHWAVVDLQRSLGIEDDGLFGPATRSALGACDVHATIGKVCAAREARYRSNPNFATFGKGWLARLERAETLAFSMAEAPH